MLNAATLHQHLLNLDAFALAALCTQLEIMAVSEMGEEITELFANIEAEYDNVKSVLLEKRENY